MADLDITIRRRNGAAYDVLHPTTIISQVTGLQTALDAKINTSARGAANGVASLDGSGKVPVGQLPDSVFDSLFFHATTVGLVNSTATRQDLANALIAARTDADTRDRSIVGYYFVVSSAGTITDLTGVQAPVSGLYVTLEFRPTDMGTNNTPSASSGTLEVGDWFVIESVTGNGAIGTPFVFRASVISNTYENADTSIHGITRLSDATTMNNLVDGVNDVITENFLFDNKVADGSELASGTNLGKIAPAAHHHNGTYLAVGGNAVTASALATARTIAASGDATWSVSFNGSANVTAGLTLATVATAGTYRSVTVNAKGLVTAGTNPTTLSGYGITDAQPLDADLTSIAGLAGTTGLLRKTAANTFTLDTATYLTGNQSISVTGDATGSGTTSIALTLANSGVTAGTYRSVTVDAKGRVTGGTNPTTLSGYGITDAYTTTQVDNLLTNRPEVYYNALGNSDGDLVLDLDSDGAVA